MGSKLAIVDHDHGKQQWSSRAKVHALLLIAGGGLLAVAIWLHLGAEEKAMPPREPSVPSISTQHPEGNRPADSNSSGKATDSPSGDSAGDAPARSFGTSGVTTRAIEMLALTDEQVGKLDQAYTQISKEVEDDFVNRIRVVDFKAHPGGYYGNYYVDARDDGGKYFLDKFKGEIDQIVDEGSAAKLKKSVNEEVFEDMLGQYEAEVEIAKMNDRGSVKMRIMDPKSGRVLNEKIYDLDYFKKIIFFPIAEQSVEK